MAEETKVENTEGEPTSRRKFVKTSAQVAVTAPAVALLLNATAKPAFAQITTYQATQSHILDDFTFGNTDEDIDALNQGSNFNPINQTANQDDHV